MTDDREPFREARAAGLEQRHEARQERAIRKMVAAELRQLGAYRREYCHSCPQTASPGTSGYPQDSKAGSERFPGGGGE